MKLKKHLFVLLLISCVSAFAQPQNLRWQNINSSSLETTERAISVTEINYSENSTVVNIITPGYYYRTVSAPQGDAQVISVPKSANTASAGDPDLPTVGIPLIINGKGKTALRILNADYIDIEGIEVAPSKGDFPRTIDPSTVPYTYNECYHEDSFFPMKNAILNEPYILRDFRGQNIIVQPFAYNPVSMTLRIYYNITVELYSEDGEGLNELPRETNRKINSAFEEIYQRHFINYESVKKNVLQTAKYTPLEEEGDMLIICHDAYLQAMEEFVNWKKTRGINPTIVGTSTTGTAEQEIKSYIQNFYSNNTNLTFVLFVGDDEHIPGYNYSCSNEHYSGKGDNPYVQIIGNDVYSDLLIGRFSAQNADQVAIQVQKTINYERDLDSSDTWCQNGLGVSADSENSGHYSEADWEHIENIREDLLNYGYNTVYQEYYNVSGFFSTTSQISVRINSGVGIINYCNHGNITLWGSHNPSYTNTYVNALTNDNKLPFIFSTACLNGKYDHTSDCFAEAWMHATNNNTGMPTGAIGTLMSYISQPWTPPMYAQDEFTDILVESYINNIKRTLGGLVNNSLLTIFDHYNPSTSSALGTYQSWILFGDPSLTVRTKTPQVMAVTHPSEVTITNPLFSISVDNSDGAQVTITNTSHEILGTTTVSNGYASIEITDSLSEGEKLILCVFGYNKATYIDTLTVIAGSRYDISYSETEYGSVTGPDSAFESSFVELNITPDSDYYIDDLDIRDAQNNRISTFSTNSETRIGDHFIMPNSDITVNATFYHNKIINIATSENGTISSELSSSAPGTTINISALPNPGYLFSEWVVFKTGDNSTLIEVTNNSFIMPEFDVTLSAIFLPGYSINLATTMYGSFNTDKTFVLAGDIVRLAATPDENCEFIKWIVYSNDDVNSEITVTDNQFAMPEYDVTVTAVFIPAPIIYDTVGSGAGTNNYIPIYANYPYSISQQIYSSDDIGNPATITAISFYATFSSDNLEPHNLNVYFTNTNKETFENGNDWLQISDSDLVFSGEYTFSTQGWNTIKFNTPFYYDGTSNLAITVNDITGSNGSSIAFRSFRANSNKALRANNYYNEYDPIAITTTGTIVQRVNQIILHKKGEATEGFLSLSTDSLLNLDYRVFYGPSKPQNVGVIGYNISSDITVTAPDYFEISDIADGLYSPTLQLIPTEGSIQEIIYLRQKNGHIPGTYQGLTSLVADNVSKSIFLKGSVISLVSIDQIEEEKFITFDGNNIIVNGTGELQVIDILGRIVSVSHINGITISNKSSICNSHPGVYIFRLIGDTIKTHKLIIK